jgi:phosphatidate cytidylyltransferase
MMSKVVSRLLIFFIGVPLFFVVIFLLPYSRHLIFNILCTIYSALTAVEISAMLEKKRIYVSKTEALMYGALAPMALLLTVSLNFSWWIIPLIIMAGASWALISQIYSYSKYKETVINNVAGSLLLMIYPAFFISCIIAMSIWENSGAIFLFLLIVFLTDSTTWLTGRLFGKNNQGLFAVSPNKSIAGFAGGLFSSVAICILAWFFFPSVYINSPDSSVSLPPAILLGLVTGIFATLGDLAESAIKRSCDVKDSGTLMMGRGGLLDSVDSVAAAAPVFFLLYSVFFYNI